MKLQLRRLSLAFVNAAFIGVAGCGGGGGGAPAASTTTNVTSTVIDGAIKNALVCVDKNANGICDPGETQGRTDAAGNVTMAVPNADVGLYPILAVVGTDAVDVDNGPVTVAYTMSAPPGKPAVVSPLTTQVQQAMLGGATLAEAEATVQDLTGVKVSLFQDYTKVAPPTDGSTNPGNVARLIVVTTQAQQTSTGSAVGQTAIDGATITAADLNKAIQQKLLEMLPALAALVKDPANTSAAALEAALNTALAPGGSLNTALLTTNAVKVVTAVNNQAPTPDVPTAGLNMALLNYTDAANWSARVFTGSLAQATPDANNLTRFNERRTRSVSNVLAAWNYASTPQSQSNLHWTGTAWEPCGLNFESTSSLPDANGVRKTNYCNNYATSTNTRANFDISGKKMIDVYNDMQAVSTTDVVIANAATVLGNTTFPTGSFIRYQTTTDIMRSLAYGPGTGSLVFNYSAALAAGGDGRTQAANTGCNLSEFQFGPGLSTTTLEGLVASYSGQPCLFNQGSLVSGPNTFYESGTQNAAFTSKVYSNNTIGIGTIGTVATNSTPTAFYTGNKLIRLGFQGTGANAVTYYSCDQRFVNGSVRNCSVIGTGAYTITSLPDGSRVMEFSNPPATPFTFNRLYVERNGKVYAGFQDKKAVVKSTRLTSTAANALFAQLGLPAVNPEVPLALTAGSYAGTWDIREPVVAFAFNVGTRVVINNDGTVACFDNANSANLMTCTLNISAPATGAFTGTSSNGATLTGTMNFVAGTMSGTFSNPSQSITNAAFVGQRR